MTTYYITTTGNDSSNGTAPSSAWRTIQHAANVVNPGDTVLVADGTYESASINVNRGGSSESLRVIFKSINKWGAIISQTDASGCAAAIVTNASYLTIDGFKIQIKPGTATCGAITASTCDMRIWGDNGSTWPTITGNDSTQYHHVTIRNCWCTGDTSVRAESLKSTADYTVYESNYCVNALELLDVKYCIIRDNKLESFVSQDMMSSKGGCRSTLIYNNTIRAMSSKTGDTLIYIGAGTALQFVYDQAASYENYNTLFFNNVLINDSSGNMLLMAQGCYHLTVANSVFIKCAVGVIPSLNGQPSDSPRFINNIFYGNGGGALAWGWSWNGTATIDYNNWFNNTSVPAQAHAITGDPKLTNIESDWHLLTGSPGLAHGTIVTFTGYYGESISQNPAVNGVSYNTLLATDFSGTARPSVWSVGIYGGTGTVVNPGTGLTGPGAPFHYGLFRHWDVDRIADYQTWLSDGSIDFSVVDAVYAGHATRGAKTIKVFGSVPTWAARVQTTTNVNDFSQQGSSRYGVVGSMSGPANLDAYEDYCFRFISHTRPMLFAVEGWNEPFDTNDTSPYEYFTGTRTQLADIQQRLYRAAKRVDPTLPVFSPAQSWENGIPFLLAAMTSDGHHIWEYFDVLAFHPYDYANGEGGSTNYILSNYVAQIRNWMTQVGINKPLADTEHGFFNSLHPGSAGPVFCNATQAVKAQMMNDLMASAKSLGLLCICWYSYDDGLTEGNADFSTGSPISLMMEQDYNSLDTKTYPTGIQNTTAAPLVEFYGDSTTAGYTGSTFLATPYPIEFGLKHPELSTKNEGVNSSTTAEMLAGTDGVHPAWGTQMQFSTATYVCIMFGVLDEFDMDITTFKANLAAMISAARSHGKTAVLLTPFPSTFSSLSGYVQAVRDQAAASNCPIIDVWGFASSYIAANGGFAARMADGVHPDQNLHIAAGDYIAAQWATALASPPGAPPPATTTFPTLVPSVSSGYTLQFADEFTGAGLNRTVWNDAIFYETSDPGINYDVNAGGNSCLRIWPLSPFVNRTIDTDGKFYFGPNTFIEARMQLPFGRGPWPGFWLLDHDSPPPYRPEVDIMEAYPGGGVATGWGTSALHANNFAGTVHYPDQPTVTGTIKLSDSGLGAPDLSTGMHVYGCKWTNGQIRFYFDGHLMSGPISFGHTGRLYILFQIWWRQGNPSGDPDSSTPTGPSNSLLVDWVRVWSIP